MVLPLFRVSHKCLFYDVKWWKQDRKWSEDTSLKNKWIVNSTSRKTRQTGRKKSKCYQCSGWILGIKRNFFSSFSVFPHPLSGVVCSVTQLCLTLCDPVDHSLPSSSVHGIFKARILEWVALSSSRESSWPRDQIHVSCLAGGFFTTMPPGKPFRMHNFMIK